MPIKPRKDEDQSDWMGRCVPEMIGTGKDKRPQEQAVAICMDIWRQEHGKAKQCEPPDDDESYEDFMDRCTDEVGEDSCQTMWDNKSARTLVHKTSAAPVNAP